MKQNKKIESQNCAKRRKCKCVVCGSILSLFMRDDFGVRNYGRCLCGRKTLVERYSDKSADLVKEFFKLRLKTFPNAQRQQVVCLGEPLIPEPDPNFLSNAYIDYRVTFFLNTRIIEDYNDVIRIEVPDADIRGIFPMQSVTDNSLVSMIKDPTVAAQISALFPADAGDIYFNHKNLIYNDYGIAIAIKPLDLSQSDEQKLFDYFSKNLGIRKVIWLPEFPNDSSWFGHGLTNFACFVDNDVLMLSDPQTEADAQYLTECKTIINNEHYCKSRIMTEEEILDKIMSGKDAILDSTPMPEIKTKSLPTGVRNKQSVKSVSGMYAGILETNRAVFVPQYGIPEDDMALRCFKCYTSKPVIGINCECIAKYGLSLGDMTKEYWV
jgi:hypothetical protein